MLKVPPANRWTPLTVYEKKEQCQDFQLPLEKSALLEMFGNLQNFFVTEVT